MKENLDDPESVVVRYGTTGVFKKNDKMKWANTKSFFLWKSTPTKWKESM